jgi:hypothetical protein
MSRAIPLSPIDQVFTGAGAYPLEGLTGCTQ